MVLRPRGHRARRQAARRRWPATGWPSSCTAASADAAAYNTAGTRLAESYRQGIFNVPLDTGGVGTQFISKVTGVVYAVTGPSLIGGYLVFSWLGFWGLLLFFRAFQIAVPGGHHRRYALMVFFLPSLLFWPSGIGKEAWMTLGLGLCAYGVALLFTRRRIGLLPLALGPAGDRRGPPARHPAGRRGAGRGVRGASGASGHRAHPGDQGGRRAGASASRRTSSCARPRRSSASQDVSVAGFDGALQKAQENTAQGGSEFAGAAITSPLGLPWAAVTVLFRPFPWEADSGQALAASAEGVLLVYLTWHFRRSLLAVPRLLRRSPYVTFSLTYLLGYIVIFSGFANFGILVRQRSLALPAFLVLLAVPVAKQAVRSCRVGPDPRAVSVR